VTYHPSHSTETIPPPEAQAEEAIHWGKVIGVGVGSLVAFSLATWISWSFMRGREKVLQPNGPDPIPVQIGQGEIGIVDQVPFDVARSSAAYRKDQMVRLEHWGWVDRKQGIVHKPIKDAMDEVVSELSGKARK
jgi:hypothetical protein